MYRLSVCVGGGECRLFNITWDFHLFSFAYPIQVFWGKMWGTLRTGHVFISG